MASLYVGLDLGGSGTRAALADAEGNVLATGRSGLSGSAGGAAGRRLLGRSLAAALAPIAARVGTAACVVHAGTRGLSLPGRRDSLLLDLRERFPNAQIHVSNDALIALAGGLGGRPGIAVLAGTGSIALARSADGREGRAGGWGYLLGDDGSGYWLGREAIAVYLQVLECRQAPGGLSARVAEVTGGRGKPEATGARGVPEAIAWVNSEDDPVQRLAGLAPLVSQAAEAGDEVAAEILVRAGRALALLAATAARQVWPAGITPGMPVACCGGVWAAGRWLRTPFEEALGAQLPGSTVTRPVLPPVAGALLLAMAEGFKSREGCTSAALDNLIEAFAPK